MAASEHHIRQVFLDITVREAAPQWANEVAEYCTEQLMLDLENWFSRFQKKGHWVIDRLDIDLGSVAGTDWKTDIRHNLIRAIDHELNRLENRLPEAGQITRVVLPGIGHSNGLGIPIRLPFSHPQASVPAEFSHNSTPTIGLSVYFQFLDTGRLPWWVASDEAQSVFDEVFRQLSAREAVDLWLRLRRDPVAGNRFLDIVTPDQFNGFMQLTRESVTLPDTWDVLFDLFNVLPELQLQKSGFHRICRELILYRNLPKPLFNWNTDKASLGLILSHREIRSQLLDGDSKRKHDRLSRLFDVLCRKWKDAQKSDLEGFLLETPDQERESGRPPYAWIFPEIKDPKKRERKRKGIDERSLPASGMPRDNSARLAKEIPTAAVEATAGEFVRYAGVVIVHPFLEAYFSGLKLLKEGVWNTPEAQIRAVQLLAFLCTGAEQCPEYEMVLFKQLCSLPLDCYVPAELGLSAGEIEESDKLLEAVISHWKALKGTSVSGLREGFLDREGKLVCDAAGWQLFVERKAQDILLQQLPWGLGIIKFPWIGKPILVSWI